MSVCEVSVRKYALFVVVFLVTVSMAAKKKPKLPDPILCGIKTVFIEGNNQSSNVLRRNWHRWTGITVVNSATDADAVLDVDEKQLSVENWHHVLETEYTVSVLLKDKAGKLLWSDSEKNIIGSLINESNSSDAARSVVFDFWKESACGHKVTRKDE